MPDIFSVEDKVVVVTGAAGGNGRAIAEGFLIAGAVVQFVDMRREILDIVRKTDNARAQAFVCDLRKKADIGRLIRAVVRRFKRIDVLVNNAGISLSGRD